MVVSCLEFIVNYDSLIYVFILCFFLSLRVFNAIASRIPPSRVEEKLHGKMETTTTTTATATATATATTTTRAAITHKISKLGEQF